MGSAVNKVILVGAPNSGKTTLYNWITGAKFRTVNYPGSTVEFSRGKALSTYGENLEVLDTPGIRSLNPMSEDERITVDCLYNEIGPGAVVAVVVDASQPERHFYTAQKLKAAGFKTEVVLSMTDLLKEKGLSLNIPALEKELGFKIHVVDGRLGGGVREFIKRLSEESLGDYRVPQRTSLSEAHAVEAEYEKINRIVTKNLSSIDKATDSNLKARLNQANERSLKVDRWLMHPVFGLLFFVCIMTAVFTSIFWAATPAMDFIDGVFGSWAELVATWGAGYLIADFVGNGLIAGVGSVLVFIPQIVILFFAMGFLEDSGYLARAATLVDKPLSKIGLNGRSFVPLLSGYACAIPAMMAARAIPNRKERLITIFIIPLMSCSARLPVWALLLGLLFTNNAFAAGIGLAAIYFASLIIGGIAGTIAARFIKNDGKSWFMLELPAYRTPHVRFVLKNTWLRSKSYLKNAGVPIVIISVIIWTLSTFPNYKAEDQVEKLNTSYLATVGHVLDPVMAPMGGDWRTGVGILAAFAAREVFVSTMAIVFRVSGETDEEMEGPLLEALKNATHSDGTPMFTTATILGLILYFIIALQCLPTVAVARTESGSRKFAFIQLAVFTFGAYALSVALVQTLKLFGVA